MRDYYVGIDMDEDNAVVSFYRDGMAEPETVSPVAGSELYQIPVCIAKRHGIGQWAVGQDAEKIALAQGEEPVDGLLQKALAKEQVTIGGQSYAAAELFALYVKKLVLLASRLGNPEVPDFLVVTLDTLSDEAAELFSRTAESIGLETANCMLLDRSEAFYYFAYSQPKELWLHDVCLFDCRDGTVKCRTVCRDQKTTPQTVTMEETAHELDAADKDDSFCRIIDGTLAGHICSSVYLTGGGFDGGWMKQSLNAMCRGRRAFMGKNLYSKGACHAAMVRGGKLAWNLVYMGDNEMKVNVSLKVRNRGKTEFYTLISAGVNWYEATGACDVILEDGNEVDFWLKLPNSREAKTVKLTLSDLPERGPRMTRLSVCAKPLSDSRVRVTIRDEGFGELEKSSGRSWEYTLEM